MSELNQPGRALPARRLVGCLALLGACVVIGGLAAAFYGSYRLGLGRVSAPTATAQTATTVAAAPSETSAPAPTEAATGTPTPSPTPRPTMTPTDAPETATPAAADDPNVEIRARVEANVVEIRGLEPREAIAPTLLTQAQLRQRIETDFFEDYGPEEARIDAIVLSAFDFMAWDSDLFGLTLDLFTEQVAGFYDPETAEFVVVSEGGGLDAMGQWTHAHEFTHALQDQYFPLELLGDESLDSEAAAALRALAEGDATLVQEVYLLEGYFSQSELMELLTSVTEIDTTVLDSAPPIMRRDLEFPYVYGLEFVRALYADGGFEAVNEAWANLPQSTEHILHPERYLAGDAPQIVSLAPLTETLGAGWQMMDGEVLGEFYTREYLANQLLAERAAAAATGWGGDRYAVYWNEAAEQAVMVLRTVWDSAAEAEEFAGAYAAYAGLRQATEPQSQADGGRCWQGIDALCLYGQGVETLVVLAPDVATAAAVAAVAGGS